jgi:uncharacterized protein YbaR (Trm112 family)
MLLALVDSLRCPAGHEESPLVLSTEAWDGPRVLRGVLGCPTCHARYPIHDGIVDFTGGARVVRRAAGDGLEPDAVRLAAQLGLSDPGGLVLLAGRYALASATLCDLADVTSVLVDAGAETSKAAVCFAVSERLPLIAGALRAAAIDEPRNTSAFLAEVARCVAARGRVVTPTDSPVPPGIRVLARDEYEWVGEVIEESMPTVPLRRAVSR